MLSGWTQEVLTGIITVNQILTAGIAITAFSLFLYALSFNLRDRVARSFATISIVRGGCFHRGSPGKRLKFSSGY